MIHCLIYPSIRLMTNHKIQIIDGLDHSPDPVSLYVQWTMALALWSHVDHFYCRQRRREGTKGGRVCECTEVRVEGRIKGNHRHFRGFLPPSDLPTGTD